MRIDKHTHWYIIHFLAHKLVFEDKVGKERHPELYLHEYKEGNGKTIREIAQEFKVDKEQIQEHNKWLRRHRVPHDTTCATIIPLTHEQYAQWQAPKFHRPMAVASRPSRIKYRERIATCPVITTRKVRGKMLTLINGIRGKVARVEDSVETLAQAGSISVKQLLALNDMTHEDLIVPGQVYYFKAKRSKARAHFHIVKAGETWWSIAQQYGITKRKLLLKNRLRQEVELQPRRVLWLRFIRPAKVPVASNMLL